MSGDTIKIPLKIDMNGLKPSHRRLYRHLRKLGWNRNAANLVVFGACLESGHFEASVGFPTEKYEAERGTVS